MSIVSFGARSVSLPENQSIRPVNAGLLPLGFLTGLLSGSGKEAGA
jgi:hypothetical protein